MKKLLLLLLCVPLIGLGQACNYGGSNDASELCKFYQGNEFASDRNADIALDRILSVTGMSKRFVLKQCSDISNCVATSYKGIRYILYDKDFIDAIAANTNSWSNLSILAHEIGHHVNGHSLDIIVYASETIEPPTLSESRQMELEADEYSGFVMSKLGATLYQAQEAVRLICTNEDDTYSSHPKLNKRLAAIERGYNKALNNEASPSTDYSSHRTNSQAMFYYNQAMGKRNYLRKNGVSQVDLNIYKSIEGAKMRAYSEIIEDITLAIQKDRKFVNAYLLRGRVYYEQTSKDKIGSRYTVETLAINDFKTAIRLEPTNSEAYWGMSFAYLVLYGAYGKDKINLEKSILYLTKAINLDPTNGGFYNTRGSYKKILGLNYCEDYNKACDLGFCDKYFEHCE